MRSAKRKKEYHVRDPVEMMKLSGKLGIIEDVS